MLGLIVTAVLAQSGFFLEHLGDRAVGRVMGRIADRVLTVQSPPPEDEASGEAEAETDADADEGDDADEVVPPVPPVPPAPPIPGHRVRKFQVQTERGARDLPRFTENKKNVPTAEVLHRIAQSAGWSMTLVGSPKEKIDVDVKDADPRDALRQVLKQSGAMGGLKNDKLVVVATPGSQGAAGMLIEKTPTSTLNGVGVPQTP